MSTKISCDLMPSTESGSPSNAGAAGESTTVRIAATSEAVTMDRATPKLLFSRIAGLRSVPSSTATPRHVVDASNA